MNARNWKWMVPGAMVPVAILITAGLLQSPAEWVRWMALVPGFVMVICAIAAVGNLTHYLREQSVSMYERRQNAFSRTPLASEIEAARGVHPDVVKMLISERKKAWMLRGRDRYDVLYGAPSVTDIFMRYILENSSGSVVMPKRLLSDGRKNRFDPMGMITEYEMYEDLMKLLHREGKIHRWSEYSPWEWVHPWDPRSVAEDYRLELEEEVPEVAAVASVSELNQARVQ